MIIETKADTLLNVITWLSKISKLNENNKSLLLTAEDGTVNMYSSSGIVYGESVVEGKIIEPGKSLLPLVVIPVLQDLGEKVIFLEVDLDEIVIRYDKKSRIKMNQLVGSLDDVSTRPTSPEWMGLDLARLKNISYAANGHGLEWIWFVGDTVMASDKIKIAVYKHNMDFEDYQFTILKGIPSYCPKDRVDLSFGPGYIWLGNDKQRVSTVGSTDKIPQPLIDIAKSPAPTDYVLVGLEDIKRSCRIAKKFTDVIVYLDTSPEEVIVSSADHTGENDLAVGVSESSTDKTNRIKLNVNYLIQALDNCIGPQIKLGMGDYKGLPLFYILDSDVTHYSVALL